MTLERQSKLLLNREPAHIYRSASHPKLFFVRQFSFLEKRPDVFQHFLLNSKRLVISASYFHVVSLRRIKRLSLTRISFRMVSYRLFLHLISFSCFLVPMGTGLDHGKVIRRTLVLSYGIVVQSTRQEEIGFWGLTCWIILLILSFWRPKAGCLKFLVHLLYVGLSLRVHTFMIRSLVQIFHINMFTIYPLVHALSEETGKRFLWAHVLLGANLIK